MTARENLAAFGALHGLRGNRLKGRIEEVLPATGYRHVTTTDLPPALGKVQSNIRVDLSGIAKGFGVDKIAGYLERIGVEYYLVEIGGELRGRGYSPRGDVWRVGI